LPSIITGVVLVAILALYMVAFQVRFTEVAVLKTFGRATPADVITRPGLYWKWPWPIQDVDIYDATIHVLETHTEQTATHDKEPVIVTSFTGWKVADPYRFLTSLRGGMDTAERRLREIIETHQKEVIGQYAFSQLVSKNAKELRFDEIEKQIRDRVQADAASQYGISIDTVGIKRLELPQDVTESVFKSMKEERKTLAQKYQSEGESIKVNIISEARSISDTILTFANGLAQKYRAEGNARAAEYYKVLQQDEALALFLDRLNKLKEILKDRTTIVLTWNQYPFTEFKDGGQIKTKSPTTKPATIASSASDTTAVGVLPGGQQ
jgi:membrane protease subunit HflC